MNDQVVVLINTGIERRKMGCQPADTRLDSKQQADAHSQRHLRRGELGHSLGALAHSVLSQLTWQHQAHSSLYLAGGQGSGLGHAHQLASLVAQALEDVIDERVHDGHSLLGDASVRVYLLQHTVQVSAVSLGTLGALLGGSSSLASLLGGSTSHGDDEMGVE